MKNAVTFELSVDEDVILNMKLSEYECLSVAGSCCKNGVLTALELERRDRQRSAGDERKDSCP